jgi:hypothetical protein
MPCSHRDVSNASIRRVHAHRADVAYAPARREGGNDEAAVEEQSVSVESVVNRLGEVSGPVQRADVPQQWIAIGMLVSKPEPARRAATLCFLQQPLTTWRAVLTAIDQRVTQAGRVIVVLDEFQRLAKRAPELGALLKRWWRERGRSHGVFTTVAPSIPRARGPLRRYFFSREGFTEELRRRAEAEPDRYQLVTPDAMYATAGEAHDVGSPCATVSHK